MVDKFFEVGDFIIVGDVIGMVECVGLKMMCICSFGGE